MSGYWAFTGPQRDKRQPPLRAICVGLRGLCAKGFIVYQPSSCWGSNKEHVKGHMSLDASLHCLFGHIVWLWGSGEFASNTAGKGNVQTCAINACSSAALLRRRWTKYMINGILEHGWVPQKLHVTYMELSFLAQQGPGKNSILLTRKGMALVSLWKLALVPSKPLFCSTVFRYLPRRRSNSDCQIISALRCFVLRCHVFMSTLQDFAWKESGIIYNRGGCTVKHCGEPITDPKMEVRCANFVAITRGCNPLPIQCKMFQQK